LRRKHNLTQLDLAEKLNYTDKAISKWERGESLPDIITLKRMADLFEVTVDYLITEHKEGEKPHVSRIKRNNKILISLIAFFMVWLLGTCAFVLSDLFQQRIWFAFVCCLPLSILVLLVFNSIWGRKSFNFLLVSSPMWTLFLALYLGLLIYASYNFWMLFIIGVPGQIIIMLCFRIKGASGKKHLISAEKYIRMPKRVRRSSAKTAEGGDGAEAEEAND
jgi:transcriptional regulator with XRE-family HTH domain